MLSSPLEVIVRLLSTAATMAAIPILHPISYKDALRIIDNEPNFHPEALPGFQPLMGRIRTPEDEDDTIRPRYVPMFTAFASHGTDPLRSILQYIDENAEEMSIVSCVYIIGTLWNAAARSTRPCRMTVKQLSAVSSIRFHLETSNSQRTDD